MAKNPSKFKKTANKVINGGKQALPKSGGSTVIPIGKRGGRAIGRRKK